MTFHLVCVRVHLTCVYILARFLLLSCHLLGKTSSLGLQLCFLCVLLFVILDISIFCFEGLIWVRIASVPGLCIIFTLIPLKGDYVHKTIPYVE